MSVVNGSTGVESLNYDDTVRPALSEYTLNGCEGSVLVDDLLFLSGFGGYFQSEALPGALPLAQQNPQKCPYNAYCELLSGTSFTTPRVHNQRTWLYRIHPTVGHPPFTPLNRDESERGGERESVSVPRFASKDVVSDFSHQIVNPSQCRWAPFPLSFSAGEQVDFIQGLHTVCGSGAPSLKHGVAIHVYTCNSSMTDKSYVNSDGDLLIVPQQSDLSIVTELGRLHIHPGHIAVIPRGIQFSVSVSNVSRGYILEVFDGHFRLPELGVVGSNGLANPRDFLHPTAWYEHRDCEWTVAHKYNGQLFKYPLPYSPFNVIAWHGNYLPYQYDLNKFVPAGSVLLDHLDPSIFTVLTCATSDPGVAAADFVIFPPRWQVSEHTFRPPWYHRNTMSEFMGNIYGRYEARPDGFLPGGASLHSCMVGHGPDADTFNKASNAAILPAHRMPDDSLAFMFETTYMMKLTEYSQHVHPPDPNYYKCWEPLKRQFDINDIPEHIRRAREKEAHNNIARGGTGKDGPEIEHTH